MEGIAVTYHFADRPSMLLIVQSDIPGEHNGIVANIDADESRVLGTIRIDPVGYMSLVRLMTMCTNEVTNLPLICFVVGSIDQMADSPPDK